MRMDSLAAETPVPAPDSLTTELETYSPAVLRDMIRTWTAAYERVSDFHNEACDREDAANARADEWKRRYEDAQAKLDAISKLLGAS